MKNTSRTGFLVLLSLVVIAFGISFLVPKHPINQTSSFPTPQAILKQVTLTLIYPDSPPRSFSHDYVASQSAFSLLNQVIASEKIPFKSKTYSFGTLVESINNLTNSPTRAWIYFVNGKSANVGADKYLLSPGDEVEWKYIQPQF